MVLDLITLGIYFQEYDENRTTQSQNALTTHPDIDKFKLSTYHNFLSARIGEGDTSMKKSVLVLGLVVLLCTAGVAQASVTNLIQNGDFEIGSFPNGATSINTQSLNGWAVTSRINHYAGNNAYEQSRVIAAGNPINTSKFVGLTANTVGASYGSWTSYDTAPRNAVISQTVALTQGVTYLLTFDFFNKTGTSNSGVAVTIGGMDDFMFGSTSTAAKWATKSTSFLYTGPTGSSIFSISGIGDPTGGGAFIDNVSLAQKPAPTPIPAAVWLLGSGLAGLVGWRKKSKV